MARAVPTARAAELLKITWDEADGIKQRAVRRGLARRQIAGLEYVCVDEKAVGRGQDYVTVVTGVVGGIFVAAVWRADVALAVHRDGRIRRVGWGGVTEVDLRGYERVTVTSD